MHVYKCFVDLTTIHGASHFSLKKGKSLYIWTLVMVANMFLTAGFIMIVQKKYYDDEIVTEIVTNCKVNQVPFPAVSICNFNLVSLKDTKNIQRILTKHKRSIEEINDFFQALPLLTHYGVETDQKGNFTEIVAILKSHYFTMDTIMEEIHQNCSDLLVYCSFNKKLKNCKNIFKLVKTSEGYCCAFNYQDPTSNLGSMDGDFEYYDDSSGDMAQTTRMIATSESGRSSGLFVILNVEPDEYPTWSLTHSYGVKILISDPNDFPEANIRYDYLSVGDSKDIKVHPKIYQAENALRRVDIWKRNCYFHDEGPLELTDRYSAETCETECKMSAFLKYCNCIPYKYPQEKRSHVCELEDLKCLHNVTVSISKQERKCDPVCYVECVDKKYGIISDTNTFLSETIPKSIIRNRNISHLSSLRVYFSKPTCNCYKMNVYIDINYFTATYGGVFSLFFGISILTVVELLYLLIHNLVVLIIHIAEYFKKKNK